MTASLDAYVFDAYGTLFDVHSVARTAEALWPGRGAAVSERWRAKQLEYTWLASLMHAESGFDANFAVFTAAALDVALAGLGLEPATAARATLLDSYLHLDAFSDAAPALQGLHRRPRWILSNGSHAMLDPLVAQSPLAPHLDGVLTVEPARRFKPHPAVYRLAVERLGVPAARIAFVSSNGWDAIGATAFGLNAFWINRSGAPVDRHGPAPQRVLHSLTELLT